MTTLVAAKPSLENLGLSSYVEAVYQELSFGMVLDIRDVDNAGDGT